MLNVVLSSWIEEAVRGRGWRSVECDLVVAAGTTSRAAAAVTGCTSDDRRPWTRVEDCCLRADKQRSTSDSVSAHLPTQRSLNQSINQLLALKQEHRSTTTAVHLRVS